MFLAVLMVAGTFAFTLFTVVPDAKASSVNPDCIPCPGQPGKCYPNCGGGGCNPTKIPINIYNVRVSAGATNVTITWDESPAAQNTYITWGNSSYPSAFSQNVPGSGSYSAYLDFLEPSTTYDYVITAHQPPPGCTGTFYITNTYSGQWSTQTDSLIAFSGTVYDSSGQHTAPAGIQVTAWCAKYPQVYFWTTTDSSGYYYLAVHNVVGSLECSAYGAGGLGAYVISFGGGGSGNNPAGYWAGYWNETVVTWDVQAVNFYLPQNYISPYFPAVLDFSNAASGYSTISYSAGSSTSYTTSFSYSWQIGSGTGPSYSGSSSTSKTYSEGSQGGFKQEGGTLDYIVQMETTGTLEFNAVYRAWAQTQVTVYGGLLNGEPAAQNPGFAQPADWLQPTTMNSYPDTYFIWNPGAGKYMENVLDSTPGFFYTGGVTTSTSTSATGGYTVTFGLTASLPGVGSVGLSVGAQWSQTSTTTYTQELDYEVGMPSGGSPICFDVIGQGGNGDATYADMFGVYVWSPNSQGGCTSP